jgi:hypothetical protein
MLRHITHDGEIVKLNNAHRVGVTEKDVDTNKSCKGIHNVAIAKYDTEHNLALECNIPRAPQRCHSRIFVL